MMNTSLDQVIADALALSRARGAELLVLLGDFDIWRGDLAEMRGDSPRRSDSNDVTVGVNPSSRLAHTLMMLKAAEILAKRLSNLGKTEVEVLATALKAHAEHADETARDCHDRLIRIYEELRDTDDESAVTPEWLKSATTTGSTSRR